MSTGTRAVRHAGGLYRKALDRALRPIRKVEREVEHLHQVEQIGESGETPFIAILGLVLFLGSIFAVMVGLAFAAYYLAA
jgi:hypothetical protein